MYGADRPRFVISAFDTGSCFGCDTVPFVIQIVALAGLDLCHAS